MKAGYDVILSVVVLSLFALSTFAFENDQGTFDVITSVPRDMTYQGILKDSAGNPLPDSAVTLLLRIYDDYTSGNLEWSDAVVVVTDGGGYFTATLTMVNLPFDEDYWLELEIEGEILTPRQKINMVGYSARSDTSDYAAAGGGWVDDGLNVRLESSYDKVGIGTSSPSNKLHVTGSESAPILNVEQLGSARAARFYSQNVCALWVEHAGNHGLRVTSANGSGVYIESALGDGIHVDNVGGWAGYFGGNGYFDGNLGIGNATPAEKLDVAGTAKMNGFKMPTGASDGYVLTSDGSGGGTWQLPSGSGDSDWVISDTNMYSGVSGNVGIGTSTPSEKLEIDGNLKMSGKATIGSNNGNSGEFGFVAGRYNFASDTGSVIGGGGNNTVSAKYATVSGGLDNFASNPYSSVGGGYHNFAYALGATVAGGYNDSAVANYSTIGGGQYNYIYGENGTIGGGAYNTANNQATTVAGGSSNSSNGNHSSIGGGQLNNANGNWSSIAGGISNDANGSGSVIAGGNNNTASGEHTSIAGGYNNSTTNNYCFIGGGGGNSAAGDVSTIAGGYSNMTSNNYSAITGGAYNRALGQASFVGGGLDNVVEGNWSAILGGMADTITSTATRSYLFGIGSKLTQPSTFMVDMPHIWFGPESTGYEFPTSDGSAGQVMVTDGGGQLSWTSAAGGNWSVTDSVLYTNDYWGISKGNAGNILLGDSANTMINLGVACTTGSSMGNYYYQTISGGYGNSTMDDWSTIGGGYNNASFGGKYQTIAGGGRNQTSGYGATVGGGHQNICHSGNTVISGGAGNYSMGSYGSVIAGGIMNRNLSDYSAIIGGDSDTLDTSAHHSLIFGSGVYLYYPYRVAFFDSVFQGCFSINRDDRNGAISVPIRAGTYGGGGGGGAYLTTSGTWTNASSRNVKDNFKGYDRHDLLEKISSMPVEFWEYRDSDERHIGPVAEDFVAAFDVGIIRESDSRREDQYLAASDVAGVALAGVKELIEIVNELREENKELKSRIEELESKTK